MAGRKYTIVIETEDGRVIKIDDAVLKEEELPPAGGILKFKAKKIIEVEK